MNNYKLTIQYDGSDYHGWQFQQNAKTVQEEIVRAIEIIVKEKVNLIGAGRTDAGVHALGQVANFRTEAEIDPYRFAHSLNGILPKDVAIKTVEKVHDEFHSRFDAKTRSYRYLISRMKSPFYHKHTYLYPHDVSIEQLEKLSEKFLGEHDFEAFAKELPQTEHCRCTVVDIGWKQADDVLMFRIEANRFLHGMVRAIVGTILTAEKNNYPESWIDEIFQSKDRVRAGYSVPSQGLYLTEIKY
jgi:tRNA pseudouridine38-40 synthase